jgi:hypothetical protein
MSKKENEQSDIKETEIVEAEPTEILPSMNVNMAPTDQEGEIELVGDNDLLGIYDEVMVNIREDRQEVDSALTNFIDMVFNEGDASNASKEAIVNLLKIKSDASDKMAKIADLMTRIKLKERNTYKPYLNANQTNNVTIQTNKRDLIEEMQKRVKKK